MSLHEYLQEDPDCRYLALGAIQATAPLQKDPDPAPTLGLLETWAFQLAGRMPLPWNLHHAIDALNQFLFQELGFHGDRDTYDDPDNAVLPTVIARRRGLPIALSILWLDLAQRLGLDAVGIGLPAHFIVGLRLDTGLLYFDPYHGGRAIGPGAAAELVERRSQGAVPFHPDMLQPVSHRAILIRLVRNLHVRYLRAKAWQEVLWTATHLILLDPQDLHALRDRARVHLEQGNLDQAAEDLEAAVHLAPNQDPTLLALLEQLRHRS